MVGDSCQVTHALPGACPALIKSLPNGLEDLLLNHTSSCGCYLHTPGSAGRHLT